MGKRSKRVLSRAISFVLYGLQYGDVL
jgi:hypothetical protein